MDRLEEVLPTAQPLLRQVDDLLSTAGAPAGHEVWRELRRVRLLPGAAAEAVATLRPAGLDEAVPPLRAGARACGRAAADLPRPGDWTGDAAASYDDLRERAAADLSGGAEGLDERLEATADLAQALADWMVQARAGVAGALATVLLSSEAVTLAGARHPPAGPELTGAATAAAEVAAHVLRAVADAYAEGAELLLGSRHLATPVAL